MNTRRWIRAFFTIFLLIMLAGCTSGKAQTKYDLREDRKTDRYNNDRYESNSQNNRAQREKYDYDEDTTDFGDKFDQNDEGQYGRDDKRNKKDSTDNEVFAGNNNEKDGRYGDDGYFQTGTASWYGREFHGKVTASGERFNMYELTAAHKTLPFGSIVKVRNLDNDREVTVKINDRGPYRGNRIIDLSYNAAKDLDILGQGKARVGITVVKKGDNRNIPESDIYQKDDQNVEPVVDDGNAVSEHSDRNNADYAIQAGAFYSKRNAENLKRKVEDLTSGHVSIVRDENMYKVRVDGINTKNEMDRCRKLLSEENISTFIIDNKE